MTKYRDYFQDADISSVVGCGLDRLGRDDISEEEILRAVNFYQCYKKFISDYPIGARRQAVEEFIKNGFVVPIWVIRESQS